MNIIDAISNTIGGYNGIFWIVFISGIIRIGFGSISALQNDRFSWSEFWKGFRIFFAICLTIFPMEFISEFSKGSKNYGMMSLAIISGTFLLIYNLIKIYGHFAEMSGIKIKRLDDFIEKETKATVQLEKVEKEEEKLNDEINKQNNPD